MASKADDKEPTPIYQGGGGTARHREPVAFVNFDECFAHVMAVQAAERAATLTRRLIEEALDTDAAGVPHACLAETAAELKALLGAPRG